MLVIADGSPRPSARVGVGCGFDRRRYLFVPDGGLCKVFFQPARRCFRQKPSRSCCGCTMIRRGPPFQDDHSDCIPKLTNCHIGPPPRMALPSKVRSVHPELRQTSRRSSQPRPVRDAGSSSRIRNTPPAASALDPTDHGTAKAFARAPGEVDRSGVVQHSAHSRRAIAVAPDHQAERQS